VGGLVVASPAARANPAYWGATIFNAQGQAPWQMSAAATFSRVTYKAPSLISWGSQFYSAADCGGYCQFQTAQFNAVRSYGAIPVFSWAPNSAPRLDRQIANGSQDAYITQWAQAAKAWGHPLFLRFAWEMNGRWFPWGIGSNGINNTPADYVAMWRHVHDIFARVGATNVTWVWCTNWTAPPYTYRPVSALYPGNAYVNWTCLDGYNADQPWLSFARLYGSSYLTLVRSVAPAKPVMLGEVSSTEAGGSKAAWIRNMFGELPVYFPKVRALVWFEGRDLGPGGHHDWMVESSYGSLGAFDRGIRSSAFKGNAFAGLAGGPIAPPS
jgi:hypothetical protein